MIINCFSKDKGWLFEDLKNQFRKIQNVVVSSDPILEADVWLCIRTKEAYTSPSIEKTIVQVHDCYDYDIEYFSKAKLILFTHPIQHYIWKQKGFIGRFKIVPIGARKDLEVSNEILKIPTVGFFCKETAKQEKQSLLFKKLILKAKQHFEFNVLLIGEHLEPISSIGKYEVKSADVLDYSRIDVLCSTSISPAIPLSVYETLAIGKPVVTTPRWFTFSSNLIYQCINEEEFVNSLVYVLKNRDYFFKNRENFKISPYLLEDWVTANITACYE